MTNVGIRRLMLRGRREAGVDLLAPSDLKVIYELSARRGEKLPVAFVLGAHPVDHVAAVMRIPIDEVGIMASLRDGPLPLVKCVTNDLMVPADAEMILEGYFDERGHVEPEGPYGEFLGYYGELKMNPSSTSPQSPSAPTRCSRHPPSAGARWSARTLRSSTPRAPK